MDRFDRCRRVFGNDGFTKLENAKVLILGVGGIGSFALDGLYRSGIGHITIVDYDRFEITNQNRQIGSEELDQLKVEVLARKYEGIEAINLKITNEWIESFDFSQFDIVVDAIDDIPCKIALAKKVDNLIVALGGAKKLDPSLIDVTSVWKTHGDPLAKKYRYELRKSGFEGGFQVVFSSEESKCKDLGSFVGVTGSFGLRVCSEVVKQLLH